MSEQQVSKGIEVIISEKNSEHDPEKIEQLWNLPSGWELSDIEVPMRYATVFAPITDTETVEIGVSVFPGEVGGVLANVNRWRSQMGTDEIDASQLDNEISGFSFPGYEGYFTRIEGSDRVLLAGGLYSEEEDRTWFVRSEPLSGSASESHEFSLLEFLKSFRQEDQK